jgi:hypothetical protein
VQHRKCSIGGWGRLRGDAAREERPGKCRGTFEQTIALGPGRLRNRGLEQLAHAAVREIAFELARARAQTLETRFRSGPKARPEQARLAETRGGFDQDEPAATLLGFGQRFAKLSELAFTLEEWRNRV